MRKKNPSWNQENLAYMLYSRAWRETSMFVKVFSRDYGCFSMVAKGAKRPYSQLRPILFAFQPLAISWTGKAEIKVLTRAELNGIRFLSGISLMSAWYMNELLIRILPSEDSYPILFDAYDFALKSLSKNSPRNDFWILRNFEWILLREVGYGTEDSNPDFEHPQLRKKNLSSIKKRLQADLGIQKMRTRNILWELTHYKQQAKSTGRK